MMNKQELVAAVAQQAEMNKAEANRAVEAVFENIQQELAQKGEVRLTGFGTFCTVERQATTGRNPRTGEQIQIAAKTSAKFKVGKQLAEAVNA